MRLLQQQKGLHDAEVERWQQILSSSVKLMDQMKNTLVELQHGIQKHPSFVKTSSDTSSPSAREEL